MDRVNQLEDIELEEDLEDLDIEEALDEQERTTSSSILWERTGSSQIFRTGFSQIFLDLATIYLVQFLVQYFYTVFSIVFYTMINTDTSFVFLYDA